jgi:hypothetical protein
LTVRNKLIESIPQSAIKHGGEELAPSVVLWTDKDRLWSAIARKLQGDLPGLITYGAYDPSSKTGPAIWIRCMLAGVLGDEIEGTPVVYLPGVGRSDLRNAEEAARPLQPLIELQYRGILWTHPNGKDWTPAAFLSTLGLDVAADEATKSALQERLIRLLESDVSELKALGRLDSVKVRNLGSDWPTAILAWMEKPSDRGDDWDAFRAACKTQYGLDPQSEGELGAAELLAQAGGAWAAVWSRFAHAPHRYPGTVQLLRSVKPPTGEGLFKPREEGYPQLNSEAESSLRAELTKVAKKDPASARKRILELETEHGFRRRWFWCELGESPLASCLEHVAQCAQSTGNALGATSVEELMLRYTKNGWQADQAAWKAYAAVDSNDAKIIGELLRTIYLPWLQSAGEVFSTLCQRSPLKALWSQVPDPAPGECLLFADGLRFDVAKMLEDELTRNGETVELKHRVSGLPSVTPTAKPAISPISDQLAGPESGVEFRPTITATGKSLQMDAFRDLLGAKGIQAIGINDAGDPQGRGWTEAGALDRLGHDEGARLAKRIPEEVKMLCERIRALLDAGWKTVRVVTDHGWLWMPGGLPKAELPAYLTESRWGRCAALKDTATTNLHTVPWHYNPSVSIAVPPGVSCFRAGTEYSHGGLSVQECVIPVLTVSSKVEATTAVVESVAWVGLRCKVKSTGGSGLRADIRTKPAESNSSVAFELKPLDADGQTTLLVSDDHEGLAVVVVLIDEAGRVVAKAPTTIGGTE